MKKNKTRKNKRRTKKRGALRALSYGLTGVSSGLRGVRQRIGQK